MPLKRYKLNLSETEKAYIAGIIDGEGCVGIRNGGPNAKQIIRMHVTNTNKILLVFLKDTIGFGTVYQAVEAGKYGRNKAVYVYEVSSYQCEILLNEIKEYLLLKREQAELALCFRKDKDKSIIEKIKTLNKKGL